MRGTSSAGGWVTWTVVPVAVAVVVETVQRPLTPVPHLSPSLPAVPSPVAVVVVAVVWLVAEHWSVLVSVKVASEVGEGVGTAERIVMTL